MLMVSAGFLSLWLHAEMNEACAASSHLYIACVERLIKERGLGVSRAA